MVDDDRLPLRRKSDHDKNAFVSVHWGLLPIDGTIRSSGQRSTTLSRKRTSNSSTLITHLLCQNNSVLDDQLATLERDSRKHGAEGENIDYSDGLEGERHHH